MIHVEGHKVKYSNCNNSAADCSNVLKLGTMIDHSKAGILQMFKVKDQGSKVKVTGLKSRSQRNIMYHQQNALRRQWIG